MLIWIVTTSKWIKTSIYNNFAAYVRSMNFWSWLYNRWEKFVVPFAANSPFLTLVYSSIQILTTITESSITIKFNILLIYYRNLDLIHWQVGQNSIWNIFAACGVVYELFSPIVYIFLPAFGLKKVLFGKKNMRICHLRLKQLFSS